MKTVETKKLIIEAGQKAIEELIKVAHEPILDRDDVDPEPEKLKNAAATKKLCIFDAFDILQKIQDEDNMIEEELENSSKAVFNNSS